MQYSAGVLCCNGWEKAPVAQSTLFFLGKLQFEFNAQHGSPSYLLCKANIQISIVQYVCHWQLFAVLQPQSGYQLSLA